MTDINDTIIIGAGFAGLIAARELSQAGQRVIVLEAKDRLGGRAWFSELNGVPIELGGGYVHWSQPHIWAEITRYGLSLLERPYYTSTNAMQKTRFLMHGELREDFTAEEARDIKAAFAEYVAPAKEVFPEPFNPFQNDRYKAYDNLSAEDRINQMDLTDLQRATLLRTSGMQCNNAPSEGGYIEALRWYALANCHDETYAASISRFTLAEGTGVLLDRIAADVAGELRLDAPVQRIERNGELVSVHFAKGQLQARHCVVATGVNVWKQIEFAPALAPQKTALSREELSGKGGKIYVELAGRFEDSRWSCIGGPILSVLPHYISDDTSVVVVFTNPKQPFEDLSVATLQREFDRFGGGQKVKDFKFHDWNDDPHVAGTWGNFRPKQFSSYFAQALQPDGNIHFATADLAKGWRGFFDGAVESGLRTARAVLRGNPG